jgi:hypothetical protein
MKLSEISDHGILKTAAIKHKEPRKNLPEKAKAMQKNRVIRVGDMPYTLQFQE